MNTRNRSREVITFTYFDADGGEEELELPAVYQVCHTYQGRGTHVNPAIDGNGLTAEDFDEQGPDFVEDYFSGVYDVRCDECGGARVVLEVDEERADKAVLDKYNEQLDRRERDRQAELAERRFCGEV